MTNELPTVVWVLESGEYEQSVIDGIYATPKAAMARYPGDWQRRQQIDGGEYYALHSQRDGYPTISRYVIHRGDDDDGAASD